MKHKIYSIALVAALCGMVFGGCKKDNPLEGTDYNTIITVKNSDAKTHYNPETHGVEWDEDDQISVTRGSNTFSTFILSDLSDGVATFVGTIPDNITEGSYYGIYPAQDGLSINDDKLNCVAIQPIQTLTQNPVFLIGILRNDVQMHILNHTSTKRFGEHFPDGDKCWM